MAHLKGGSTVGGELIATTNDTSIKLQGIRYLDGWIEYTYDEISWFKLMEIVGEVPSDLNIVSIASLSNLSVPLAGTVPSLPSLVTVTLSDSTTRQLGVIWGTSVPPIDTNTPGTYVYSGDPIIVTGITNTNDVKASVSLVVLETSNAKTIVSVSSIPNVDVLYGDTNPTLPSNVSVTYNNATTGVLNIVWDASTPAYTGTTAGSYVYQGTLQFPSNISNPNNIKATVTVVVAEQSANAKQAYIDLHTPRVGTNYIKDAKFRLGTPSSFWGTSSSPAITAANGIATITTASGNANLSTGPFVIPTSTQVTLSYRVKIVPLVVDGTPSIWGFGVQTIGSNYNPVPDIITTTDSLWINRSHTFTTTSSNTEYLFSILSVQGGNVQIEEVMLNTGSTALPFAFNTMQELLDEADILFP